MKDNTKIDMHFLKVCGGGREIVIVYIQVSKDKVAIFLSAKPGQNSIFQNPNRDI